jgi:hypothetical protein
MTSLIATPWQPTDVRPRWQAAIESRAAALESPQRREFLDWTGMIAAIDESALARLTRRPRRATNPRRDAAAVEVLFAHRARALDVAEAVIASQPMAEGPRAAMLAMVEQTRAVAAICPCLPVFDFPAAISEQLRGDAVEALAASPALCLYYMGISLFDDVIDRDLGDEWSAFSPEQVSCAALTMVSALPFLALPPSHLLDAVSWARVIELLGQGSAAMAEGQFLDIGGLRVDDTSIEACEHIVELKTGSTGALATALTAAMLGGDRDQEARLAEAGFNLYCAMQVISDIQDVWSKPISKDLGNGIVTPPVSWFLESASTNLRAEFLGLFRAGSENFDEHQRMRGLLEAGGALRYAICRAELYRRRAAALLDASEAGDSPLWSYMLDAARLGELPA